MTTNAVLHSHMASWLNKITGLPVVKAYPGKNEPAHPYLVINFLSMRELRDNAQEVEYENVGEDVRGTPVIETEWMYSVHAYGGSPTDILRPVRSAAHLAQVTEPLSGTVDDPDGLKFSIHDTSIIRYVPEFVNEAWEPRAQMDIFLRGLTKDGHMLDVIEQYTFEFDR